MNLTNNTLTATGATAGGIPAHDGTKYTNKAIGGAGSVPTVNAGGTDWTWATNVATNVADNTVSTIKIQNSAVTNDKLAGSIAGSKLLNGSIGDEKLLQILDHAKLPDNILYDHPEKTTLGWFNNRHATAHNGC